MSPLSPPIGRLLALTLLIACIGAVYLLLVEPLQQRHAALDDAIASSQELLQRFAGETADPAALAQQRDALRRSPTVATTGLLRGDNETLAGAFVQSFLTTTIERAGGSVRSIQVLPVREELGLRRISTRAQLHVTSTALRDVLHRLEGSDPYLFVDNLDIRQAQQPRPGADETEEVELLVRFDLRGYLAPKPVAEERS
ncbi:MAG: type II secretion system protein GspM [Kiloniellaceae bacterium]